jgi:hypothetical protein
MTACPCLLADQPCGPGCTCRDPLSSRGCSCCCTYGSHDQRRAAANRIVAGAVMAKWIKCDDRLPSQACAAMGASSHGDRRWRIRIVYWQGGEWLEAADDGGADPTFVSHWMPLPDPPTE